MGNGFGRISSDKTECSSYAARECGRRGEWARGVRGSVRLPEVDRTGIRGWREAEVTCWSEDWKRGGGKDEKHRQSSFLPLSFSVSVLLWKQSSFFSEERSVSILKRHFNWFIFRCCHAFKNLFLSLETSLLVLRFALLLFKASFVFLLVYTVKTSAPGYSLDFLLG